jgi:hypothetical protein
MLIALCCAALGCDKVGADGQLIPAGPYDAAGGRGLAWSACLTDSCRSERGAPLLYQPSLSPLRGDKRGHNIEYGVSDDALQTRR